MPLLPRPYEDELIGSIIIRGFRRQGRSLKLFVEELAGAPRGSAPLLTIGWPQRFGLMAGLTPFEVVTKHTVVPYGVAYMAEEEAARLLDKLLGCQQNRQVGSITRVSSPVFNTLRYCPDCCRESKQRFGETYWRRLHQLPGVLVCHEHNSLLLQSSMRTTGGLTARRLALPEDHLPLDPVDPVDPVRVATGQRWRSVLAELAKKSETALNKHLGLPDWRERAVLLGYELPGGEVAATAIAHDLRRFYGPRFLTALGLNFEENLQQPWPTAIFRPRTPGARSTIKFILTELYLELNPNYREAINRKRPGKRPRDYDALDAQYATAVQAGIEQALRRQTRVSVKELLLAAGAGTGVHHYRHKLPKTNALLDAYKATPQAERQRGRRPRKRMVSKKTLVPQ